jgi:hypothetical protein
VGKAFFDERWLSPLLAKAFDVGLAAARFLGFYEVLRRELEGKDLEELLREERYKKILLGGLDRDYKLASNALAHFYRQIYGIGFNMAELIARMKAGMGLEEAGIGLKAAVEPLRVTPKHDDAWHAEYGYLIPIRVYFTARKILSTAQNTMMAAAKAFGGDYSIEGKTLSSMLDSLKPSFEGGLERGDEGVAVFKELLEKSLSISPNYDKGFFTVVTLRRIPWFYFTRAYSGVSSDRLEFLEGVMGWVEHFVPEVPNESIKKNFTVMGYGSDSLGESLIDLIFWCWRLQDLLVKSEVLKPFDTHLESEPKKYVKRCLEAISPSHSLKAPLEEAPLYTPLFYSGKYPHMFYYALKPLDDKLSSWSDWTPPVPCRSYLGSIRGLVVNRGREWYDLASLLRFMAPQMYLGIATMERWRNEWVFIFYG